MGVRVSLGKWQDSPIRLGLYHLTERGKVDGRQMKVV